MQDFSSDRLAWLDKQSSATLQHGELQTAYRLLMAPPSANCPKTGKQQAL
jgi:hypothetical protein